MTIVHIPTWTLSDRLAKARTDAGLSVSDMARLIGTSRQTISRYESGHLGKRGVPRSVLMAYSTLTGVPIEWLLGLPHTDDVLRRPTSEYGQPGRIAPGHGPPASAQAAQAVDAA